jgi:hypothetical protein
MTDQLQVLLSMFVCLSAGLRLQLLTAVNGFDVSCPFNTSSSSGL